VPTAPPPRAGLPRAERLRSRAEFDRLFHRGARIEGPAFVLLWMREPGARQAGFVAGRRLGGSVVRNRARRRLREAYRRQRAVLPPEGLRLCFVARRGAVTDSFDRLADTMGRALGQVGRRGR
jgi:ribonuclease P protein component